MAGFEPAISPVQEERIKPLSHTLLVPRVGIEPTFEASKTPVLSIKLSRNIVLEQGFELWMTVSKTVVLPLDDSRMVQVRGLEPLLC